MSFYKLIFSPTGGTEKIADIIVKEWTQPVTMIDLSKVNDDFSKYSFNSEDVVLIAMPSFGGRLPAAAAERHCKGKFSKMRLGVRIRKPRI